MNLSGPQSDRDLFWRKGEILKSITHEESAIDGETNRLKSENDTLKEYLRRTLKELRAYQLKYPSPLTDELQKSSDGLDVDLPELAVSPEATSALFIAYDIQIRELESTIADLHDTVKKCKNNAELVLSENEDLRSAHLEGMRTAIHGAPSSTTRLDPNAPLNAEVIADLQEQIDVLRNENNLLIEQRSVLLTELDNHQLELERKTSELTQQTQQLVAAVTDVQTLSKRAEQAENDRDVAAAQALGYSDVLGKAEVDHETLVEQIATLTQRCKDTEVQVNEYKRQLREMSCKGDDESMVSIKRVQHAENRVRELHAALFAKSHELDTANELVRKLRSEYQTTRQDAEGMLQVMGGLERQLNEYSTREAEVDKRDKASRERQEETLTFREQCTARDDQNKREIERLLAERKLIALRRKDEIERAVENTRKAMGEQVATLEKEIDFLSEKNAKLLFDAEKAGRDGRSAEELCRRLHRLHDEETKATQGALREFTERLEAMTKLKEQEGAKRQDAQEQLRELRMSSEKLHITIDDLRTQLSQTDRAHDASISALKAAMRDMQTEVGEKTRLLARKNKDFEELKSSTKEQIELLDRRLQEETVQLQRRSVEADRAARDLEAAGFASDLRMQSFIDQIKEKYATAAALLEARLRSESDTVKCLSTKIRQSESVIADLLDEKTDLIRTVEVVQSEMQQQDEELAGCKATIADLASQLSSSHLAREEGTLRAAKTIEELHCTADGGGNLLHRSFEEYKDDYY